MTSRLVHRGVAGILLVLLVAACGDDAPSTSADHRDDMPAAMPDHMDRGGDSDVAERARVIEMRATSFEFDPPELRAGTDQDLAIELTSDDILHDFTIDELDAHIAASGGETATGGFNTGEEPGTYIYYCSVPGHRAAGMEGELVIE